MALSTNFLCFLIFLAFSNIVVSASNCNYRITVKTGTKKDAGTDAIISLKLSNNEGEAQYLSSLEAWGAMEPGHNYFEIGNEDVFTGSGECTSFPLCSMKIVSDGSGYKPGWYCEYVNVVVANETMSYEQHFAVHQWLAVDEKPNELYAIRDNCDNDHKNIGKVKSAAGIAMA